MYSATNVGMSKGRNRMWEMTTNRMFIPFKLLDGPASQVANGES